MISDGEAVVLDKQGRSDFNLLQSTLWASSRKSGNLASPAILYAFDLHLIKSSDLMF